MNRWSRLLVGALALAIIVCTIASPITYSISLYNSSREPIPKDLPWYPLIVFGDNRPRDTSSTYYSSIFYTIIREAKTINPVAVIGTGDHTGRGTRRQIDRFVETMEGLSNVWVCLGNHDLKSGEKQYWVSRVAPEFYRVDSITGWSIVFINSDAHANTIKRKLRELMIYNNVSYIIVVHRPLYPNVGHNIYSDKRRAIEEYISRYNVKLVLQGHWHSFASMVRNGVEYIITGGAGAPLYEEPSSVSGAVIVNKYHYLVLILYPNGTYTYNVVDPSRGSIAVEKLNETTWRIVNTKRDVWGNPITIPVRIKVEIDNKTYYVVVMTPPSKPVIVGYSISSGKPVFHVNTSNWYSYGLVEGLLQSTIETPWNTITTPSTTPSSTPATTPTTPTNTTETTPTENKGGIPGLEYAIAALVVFIIAVIAYVATLKWTRKH